VIALIGERGREVKEFIERDLAEGLKKSVVVVATSDKSALIRRMVPLWQWLLQSILGVKDLMCCL